MTNSMGIRGFDYVEFYVGSAKMAAYWYAKSLGFEIAGYTGFETANRKTCSYFLKQNSIKIVVTSALSDEPSEIQSFLNLHGDGVKRFAYQVDNVEDCFFKAKSKGAIVVTPPHKLTDENGEVWEAGIRVYDDTEIVFVNYDNYKGIFKPGFGKPVQNIVVTKENPNLMRIDHIVGNVRENEMDKWVGYYNQVFDFETFVEFKAGDITTQYSALLSKVVRSSDNVIKQPVNEPYEGRRKSQIEEYLQEYKGSGVQHIAIATPDILKAIKHLRANGVEFLEAPDTYYDKLRERNLKLEHSIDDLQALGILCDFEGEGYLLQLFTKPIGDRPTFFFEIIQRCGKSEGFGKGNFQALFESIEKDQAKRGNL